MNEKYLSSEGQMASLADGARVVLCVGGFQLLHPGNLQAFREARLRGDMLVVGVFADRVLEELARPISFPQEKRLDAVASIGDVAHVVLCEKADAADLIRAIRPAVFCKSRLSVEQPPLTHDEAEALRAVGGEALPFDGDAAETASLLRDEAELYPPDVRRFLEEFGARWSMEAIQGWLDKMHTVKVLTIGDAIIDEYQFCQTMGKSGKFPVLAARHLYTEKYAGGIMAIANHTSTFSQSSHMLTMLGEMAPQKEFVVENLLPGVSYDFVYKPDAPTLVKRRFLEEYRAIKMFEVYEMRNEDLFGVEEEALLEKLDALLPQFDIALVADFGHGMISEKVVARISEKARFLALNVQTNAGNKGYNFVTKYPRADFIVIDEPEARLEMRNRCADLQDLVGAIAERMSCERFIVTRGKNGCLCYDRELGFSRVPAFAINVVDSMGAGDAFLSVASLSAVCGAPMEISAFLGNVAGAIACGVVGNKEPVTVEQLKSRIGRLI